jgi:hypothetical protein
MNVSTTLKYNATPGNSPVRWISVAVVRSTRSSGLNEPEISYNLSVRYFDSQENELASPQFNQKSPHLRANFHRRNQEVRIHNIERGCIAEGQHFMARTFTQVLEVSPEYQTFVLSNLTNRSITASGLDGGIDVDAKLQPVGILLQSLFACGLRSVRAFHDDGSAYIGLRAERHDAA